MVNIINKIKQLNTVFQHSITSSMPLNELCHQLSNIINSNIYLFYPSGQIFSYSIAYTFQCPHTKASLKDLNLPNVFLDIFHKNMVAHYNVFTEKPICTCEGIDNCIFSDRYHSMVPIMLNFSKKAGMLLIRYGEKFTADDEILCEYTAAIISIELLRQENENIRQEALEIANAKLALQSLSFSELKSVVAVLKEITDTHSTIFLNSIANEIFVTQSTVTSALKKLEVAGIIKTKSMGVKGKYIKIINPYLRDEILKETVKKQI